MKSIVRVNRLTNRELLGVITCSKLSQGAKSVYSFISALRSGSLIGNDDFITNNVVTSIQMLNKYKRELKEHKLLHENKDRYTNIRFMYIGSYEVNALVFADDWVNVPIENQKYWNSEGGYE